MVKDAIELAKSVWTTHLAKQIHNMSGDPKTTWAGVKKLQACISGHHTTPTNPQFYNKNHTLATSDKENIEILSKFFEKIYNSETKVDFSILDDITQQPPLTGIGTPITYDEFHTAINKLTSGKAPGLNGVTTDALKALDDHNKQTLFTYIHKFFDDPDYDIPEWHVGNLKILPKKGDLHLPNNWRGINLLDTCSKIMSIIVTRRLQIYLLKRGTKFQFGCTPKVGCQHGSFTLRTILQTRKEHNQDTWCVFVDLVKAFDTVNHSLLFLVLAKFGIPEYLICIIKKLYNNNSVQFTVGKEKQTINYTTGVKQGDNLAPTLFILMMQALEEITNKHWQQNNITPAALNHSPPNTGSLANHKTSSKPLDPSLPQLLAHMLIYVDDCAALFNSRADAILGITILEKVMKRLGLKMHTGNKIEKRNSKTEAIFFPSSRTCLTWIKHHESSLLPPTTEPSTNTKQTTIKHTLSAQQKDTILHRAYSNSSDTNNLPLPNNNHIPFTKTFRYLGTQINFLLQDEEDIRLRIIKAK